MQSLSKDSSQLCKGGQKCCGRWQELDEQSGPAIVVAVGDQGQYGDLGMMVARM
jgi:hypothetical protein